MNFPDLDLRTKSRKEIEPEVKQSWNKSYTAQCQVIVDGPKKLEEGGPSRRMKNLSGR